MTARAYAVFIRNILSERLMVSLQSFKDALSEANCFGQTVTRKDTKIID